MKHTLYILGLSVVVLWLVTGCQPKVIESRSPSVNLGYAISRYVDEEAGVVCWVYGVTSGGGLSCLPIADTRLDE